MKSIYLFLLVGCIFNLSYAQEKGHYYFSPEHGVQCISEKQHKQIEAQLRLSQDKLIQQGILPKQSANSIGPVLFEWPVAQNNGLNDYGVHGISNFVDHNAANPNQILDYNCGSRTYDVSGYNHAGTDIFTWPFSWYKMDQDQVKIIAAAAGTILYKSDGNFDKNCSFNNGNWNAVYVQHADGSVAWYGHMKSGSLTTKLVGQTVAQGEYLGIVGSSGNSTGPHLHFEVYNANNQLIDPYAGNCNSLNATSCWNSQRPYYDSYVNALRTQSAPPVFPSCPQTETPNERTQFCANDLVYYAAYFRDQQNGQVSQYKIIQPDQAVWMQWSNTFNVFYAASYWYWSYYLPSNASTGKWTFQVDYNGHTFERFFDVIGTTTIQALGSTSICDGDQVLLTAPISANGFTYQWYRNNVALLGQVSSSLLATSGGDYYCEVSVGNCVSTSNVISITVNFPPQINIASNPSNDSVCVGSMATLMASGANSYVWNNGITNGVPFSPLNTSTYMVTASDINGCTSTATKTLTVYNCGACPANVTISTTPYLTSLIESSTWIQTNGIVIIPASAQVKFDADALNGYVQLNPGFYAMNSSVFVAQSFNGCLSGSPLRPMLDSSNENSFLLLYPNPNDGHAKLIHPSYVDHFSIYDQVGRCVKTYRQQGQTELEIDLHTMSDGIYFIHAEGMPVIKCVKN